MAIDPGHGGSNVGARGAYGMIYEKDLTLILSRLVARELEARGLRAVLTRERDTYVSLRRRMKRAEGAGAEAFVSVHANATASGAERGFETFILTPRAADVDAGALRVRSARAHPEADEEIAPLVHDVERAAAVPAAAELAAAVQEALRGVRGQDADRGVKQAPFHVLLGAGMPAVLVEVGFLDHPREGLELLFPGVQEAIARAIAEAVAGERGVGAPAAVPPGIADAGDSR